MTTFSTSSGDACPEINVSPLNGNIGAEVSGVALSGSLTEAQIAKIRQFFVQYQVLVFRDQDISLDDQVAFAGRFGDLSIHPFSPNLDEKREVIALDNSAENPPVLTDEWHSDETFRSAPPMATLLRAKVIPAKGGDTLFSSMTAAYQGLSEQMKQYIHGLEALHDFKPFRTLFGSSAEQQNRLKELERTWPNPWHPVVSVHPESGRRLIFVNSSFTVKIKDLAKEESEMILNFLYSRASIPEYQLRVRWRPNTLVMWDNRSVQHYAVHDYYPQRRTMDRVTIAGTPVAGVHGPYAPEEGVAPLPDGHNVPVTVQKRPVREFDRAY